MVSSFPLSLTLSFLFCRSNPFPLSLKYSQEYRVEEEEEEEEEEEDKKSV
jgi:hypothetical protein